MRLIVQQTLKTRKYELQPISIRSDVIEHCSEDVQKNKGHPHVNRCVAASCKRNKTVR